jgi:hypothetical protein
MVDAVRMNVDNGAADDGLLPPAGPDDFQIRRSDQGLEGGVNSALSCKQDHAHTATLPLGGWWN